MLIKSVCGGAGSSAVDTKDIGIVEATKRVTDYAQPFFSIGASCYFADNYTGGVDLFLTKFFNGKNIEECYKASTNYGADVTELKKPFTNDNKKQIFFQVIKAKALQLITVMKTARKQLK